jgi:hypothetical protein
MADKTNPELAQSDAVSQVDGSEQELEGEDALDDQNYSPEFIERLIKNPPLLPGENSYEFEQLFEHFENTHLGRAKSPTEYVLVANVTLLTWEVMRYYRIKASITVNQQRGASSPFS